MAQEHIYVVETIEQGFIDTESNFNELYAGKQTYGRDQNRFDLTGLTGGESTDLDSLPTEGANAYQVGDIVSLVLANIYQKWQLQAGTGATDTESGVVRPADYASSTNEKNWVILL